MFRNSLRLCSTLACRLHPYRGSAGLQHVRCISQSVVSMNKDAKTHYELLGLPSSASQTQIRNAYLQLSKQQLTQGGLNSKEKFAQLKEAYDVLSDSSSRISYDQQLGLVTKGSAPAVQSYVSQKKEKMHSLAKQHDSQLVTDGIYRKLMVESRKKIEHNIDISPQICLVIMCIALIYASIR